MAIEKIDLPKWAQGSLEEDIELKEIDREVQLKIAYLKINEIIDWINSQGE